MVDEYLRVSSEMVGNTESEDQRPWGYYEVLSDCKDHKVKRIVVFPGKRLSLQRHFHRSEHWMIVKGAAKVTRGSEEIELNEGEAIDIPKGTRHRVQNLGKESLIFIEIQTGDYFGEDDVERFEDDFGRV